MAEKYSNYSSYNYTLNNPIKYTDPNGTEIDLSGMSNEDERKKYKSQVATKRENSKLFDALYSTLEKSKNVFSVNFGQTELNNSGDPVEGQFTPNKKGGGTVTFLTGKTEIESQTMAEEFFHAYQNDNKNGYVNGEFNKEFEAKVAATAISTESGSGYGNIGGMGNFQTKIGLGDYGKEGMQITPENVGSKGFANDYRKAANGYSQYNKSHNIGNSNYQKSTTIAPSSLIKLIKSAYAK